MTDTALCYTTCVKIIRTNVASLVQ
jgi:hypothetical protein